MSRRRKELSSDDAALWQEVVKTADPLHPTKRASALPEQPKPKPSPKPDHTISHFQLGQQARAKLPSHDIAPALRERMNSAPLRMDKKTFTKMRRGKVRPEGKMDLHGMTLAAAHPTLMRFVMDGHADGKRLLLVVTGKGKSTRDDGPIPIRRGVLRHQVPQWLAMPPMGAVVSQVTQAHISHGGEGAYYVYLRRAR